MSVTPNDFRQALSRFASGVTVITARTVHGVPVGVTISAFSSLSLSPPLILACLDLNTANLKAYTDGPGFCVNILADDQADMSNAFAYPGPTPPCERFNHSPGMNDVPVLADTLAALECTVDEVHAGGDHVIVVGRVERARWSEDKRPLVHASGAYRSLGDPVAKT